MYLIPVATNYNGEKYLVPPGLEPGTFRVLSERDNHYTMELYNFENYCSYDSLIRYMNYFL